MLILSLDTSSVIASAALCKDGEIIASCEKNSHMNHSCTILPVVEEMLENEKVNLTDIDAFAASIGPGSFTGIRIGVAAIKGYAWAMDKPCAGVSTLASCAWAALKRAENICGVIKARENEFFYAFFKSDGENILRITDETVDVFENILEKIKAMGFEMFISGDNSEEFAELCKNAGFCDIKFDKDCVQSAASTAVCAYKMAMQNELISAHALTPSYLRLSQAEQALQNRKGNLS